MPRKVYPHGTANRYANNGCRCQPCRDAAADRMRVYRSKVKSGGLVFVPAETVVPHLKRLRKKGVGVRAVAAAVGLSPFRVYCLRSGRSDRVSRKIAARILALDESAKLPGATVPGSETRRALRRLRTLGVARYEVSEALGWRKRITIKVPPKKVTLRTQRIVREFLDEVQQAGELGKETASVCLECGLSHAREDRRRRLKRFDEVLFMDAHEAWPCIYPHSPAGERLFYYDRDAAQGKERKQWRAV